MAVEREGKGSENEFDFVRLELRRQFRETRLDFILDQPSFSTALFDLAPVQSLTLLNVSLTTKKKDPQLHRRETETRSRLSRRSPATTFPFSSEGRGTEEDPLLSI